MHSLEKNYQKNTLNSFLKEGYEIIYHENSDIIIRKEKIIDEETYIKITISILNKNNIIKKSKSKIVDLTKAFEYAKAKGKYNKLNNKFDWYIRNIIVNML